MNNLEKFLPIGTICDLKGAKKKVMIIGYLGTSPTINNNVKDYIGCIFPEGIISSDKSLLFNHEDIERVYYIGFKDDECNLLLKKLKERVN